MSVIAISNQMLSEWVNPENFFASAWVFIAIFMAIVVNIKPIERVIHKKALLRDYALFVVLFGLFSILGTYAGVKGPDGSISNFRDVAPIVAGLVAGPYVGLAVGLIGGVHRFFLGGISCVPCSLATVLIGLIAGLVYRANRGQLLGLITGMALALALELFHTGLALVLIQPFSAAVNVVLNTFPPMIIIVPVGVGISIIILKLKDDLEQLKRRITAE
ncbi:MAG: LytS/YhcK type 5TM receptor domain-containing protein [Halobacteriota archaeon]